MSAYIWIAWFAEIGLTIVDKSKRYLSDLYLITFTENEWIISNSGQFIDAKTKIEPVSNEYYYIVTNKCTECTGFHEEPQCAAVCPVDCCIPDPENEEAKDDLLAKKAWLHQED
jgi:ferredoxin